MTELETLKDLETPPNNSIYPDLVDLISREELKAEAIKWINSKWNATDNEIGFNDWLEFFNITDEDLK